MVKRKQAPNDEGSEKAELLTLRCKALPAPRPNSSMYESWVAVAKACGFFKEPLTESQRLAEQLENPDPHARLAAALKTAWDARSRAAGRGTTETTKINTLLKAKLTLMGVILERPFRKASETNLERAMKATGITPLPTVGAFVKWLRRSAAE